MPAKSAQPQGLLHDGSVAGLNSSNHLNCGAQLISPDVDEEVAWASRTTGHSGTSTTNRWATPTHSPTSKTSAPITAHPSTCGVNTSRPEAGE